MRRVAIATLAACAATAAACNGGSISGSGDDPDAAIDAAVDAPRPPAGDSRGSYQLTYYWVTTEDEFTGAADTTIYTPQCVALASVPAAFASSLRIEGTGRLADGRVINVTGTCMCMTSPCYREVDAQHPWGYGASNRALVPFRPVAAAAGFRAFSIERRAHVLRGVW
jgi:predicted small secreted protein